jgi:hypothetical protein
MQGIDPVTNDGGEMMESFVSPQVARQKFAESSFAIDVDFPSGRAMM